VRKCVLIAFLISFLFILKCTKEYTRLSLQIGEQPEGGSQVTEVSIVIVARLENGDTPIQAAVKWWAKDINGQNQTEYWADTWTFRETEWQELSAMASAPAGNVLLGYFWFEVVWEDEDGTENQVFSDTAYCHL
jgi:hypothetical protein